MDVPALSLPPGFVVGTTTSAFQTEGAVAEDGRGPSVWDTFTQQPGRVADGSTGTVAADAYHRVEEDVALLRGLGVGGYRFSISWSRVQPTGRGGVNQAGLDHYDRLVDRLLEAGIDPMVTLHHHDLPQALEDDGGWLNRATIDAFADYAGLVADRLADRVRQWVPIAEPNVAMGRGYGTGDHAPGRELYLGALPAGHHLLVAHGRAAIELRRRGAVEVGCANNHSPMWPATEDVADIAATKLFDTVWNAMFLEPMLLGRYPVDIADILAEVVREGDMATIRQPLDFYGVNYYSPIRIAAADGDAPTPFRFIPVLGHPMTAAGWAVVPHALREWLVLARARYRAALPPLVITESGASFDDVPGPDGFVDDQDRIDYLARHLEAVTAAVERGVDVRGFYVWSLLDTFEWQQGLASRYGLVRVDPETQDRTPKRSYHWLAEQLAACAGAEA